jgi:DNA-binding Xre family transcriptional regulator
MLLKVIKVRIREVAEAKGITTGYQLQKFLNVQPAVAYKWFNNKVKMIDIESLDLLCRKLGCEVQDLLHREK